MNDVSLIEKIKTLMSIIASSPLFLFCFMIAVAVLILFIISIKKEKRVNKWIFISIWLILALLIIINHNKLFLKIIDNLFDAIFMVIYFPSATVYFIILFISNFFFILSLFRKKLSKKYKIINFIYTAITDLFLILIMDTIEINSIDIYNKISMYTNFNVMILMQLNSAIFISWILISLLVSAHDKLKKYDKKELPEMPEIVFDYSE
ncbi:MAG: hypothetical protein IJE04_03730 [Bacilli bacterium]|nr:hypothetical protein [Bacilli bacterium]